MEANAALERALELLRQGVLTIDDEGRIWRYQILTHGYWKAIEPRRAENPNAKGYLRLTLAMPGLRVQSVQAHRVIWTWFNGLIPESLQINHKDSNKTNNRLSNLEIVDASGNIRHSYATGTRPHPWSKAKSWRGTPRVPMEALQDIVKLRNEGMVYREIAEIYGISVGYACAVYTKFSRKDMV